MGKQTFVVLLSDDLARRVRSFLKSGERGYASFNEFVEVALFNQLNMEATGSLAEGPPGTVEEVQENHSALLARPEGPSPVPLAEDPVRLTEALFVLTNRLSPIKMATRVLANLAAKDDWPSVEKFRQRAARAARELGRRLRREDEEAGHGGLARRWIGYPIGHDERATLDRFIYSFTVVARDGAAGGPLAVLGLAGIVEGRVALTGQGWRLASAPSPLVDGATGLTLSADEVAIFVERIMDTPAELEAIREFLQLVRRAAGHQGRIDELIATLHPDWSQERAIAHRAAMIGRLGDLGMVEVTGRGPQATVQLLPSADVFAMVEHGNVVSLKGRR
jgi:hypothetical protein